jgi:thiol-disulfide isomerase/thioredoxin
MQELTQDNLGEILKTNKKVMVQYGAGWCGACRLIKPQFKKMSEAEEDIQFYYVDAEKFPGSRDFVNLENLPTFAGFVDGQLIKQVTSSKIDSVKEVLSEITRN